MAQVGGIQALLLGGGADGRAIRLQELHRELVVFLDDDVIVIGGGSREGVGIRYQLVEPVGPEMPVYVQS